MQNESTPTLKQLADHIGVSISTVSRVLNGVADRYRISKKTQETILSAAKALQFEPNALARSLRTNRTQTIGLIIPDISNPFFANIASNVEKEARKLNYTIILCDSEEETGLEKETLNLLRNRKVDGLIVCPVGTDPAYLVHLRDSGVSLVIIDRYFPGTQLPYVASDNYQGAYEATNHLIEAGHSQIACIRGIPGTTPSDKREEGFRSALGEAGIQVDESLIVGDNFGEENGYLETKLLLNRPVRPTAILGISNLISIGAIRAISEEGLSVPEDVSIISFEEQPYSAYLATPMTTVAQQHQEMGRLAVKMLVSQMSGNGEDEAEGVLLPTKLIIRKSVGRKN